MSRQPLSVTHPRHASWAVGWDPSKVSSGSNRKLVWRCENGHQTIATPHNKTKREYPNCSVCTGAQVLTGVNDLATTHPEIAKQSFGWDPTTVRAGSNIKRRWICSSGHQWVAMPITRTSRNSECGVCANRFVVPGVNDLATTHPEFAKQAVDWDPTTIHAGGRERLKWRCTLGHVWIAFPYSRTRENSQCGVCTNRRLLVGYNDLATTHPKLAKEAAGWDPKSVMTGTPKLMRWRCYLGHEWISSPHSRIGMETGCPTCVNKKVLSGFNDLGTTHPEIAKQASGWDPSTIVAGSHKKQKWVCNLGHEWIAPTVDRTSQRSNCPICGGKRVLPGFNDLATTHPELARQAVGWDPSKVIAGSNKRLKWRCEFGHEWRAMVAKRTYGRGCPSCANSGFDPNKKGWLYFLWHPVWELNQIGITNVPKNRMDTHRYLGWEILDIRGPMDGHLAREWETSILRMLKRFGAQMAPQDIAGKFTGFTESWVRGSLPVSSINELMRMVEEDEDRQES